ncbi:MAG: hopanoid-associated sugar epimerase [Candidatus Methylomirabilales bacterium]
MKVLVTGATGFVGANLVRELLRDGTTVRVLVRSESTRATIEGLGLEAVPGDLQDRESLRRALKGCQVLYHVAARYSLFSKDAVEMYRANVEGTRNILEVALGAGVERAVYTSTVGTLGIPKDGLPGTEKTPVRLGEMVGPYKRSKFLAEQEAERIGRLGLPLVIVNPSTPVGPWDVKPTPTGRMVLDYLKGRMFGYIHTGLNLVHVRDVARGHILAAQKGRNGEKYILGNQNLTLVEIFRMLEEISGVPAPRLRIPYPVALLAACASELYARGRRQEPQVPLTGVRMGRKVMFFDPSKAIRELQLPQTPVQEALREAVEWFWAHGYAPRKGTGLRKEQAWPNAKGHL